jgi:hypothetical protein
MPSNSQIKLAKEIKMNFFLILIGAGIVLVFYLICYVALKPPVNPPISESAKLEIRKHMYSGNPQPLGRYGIGESKYDWGVSIENLLVDNINENRMAHFKGDIQDRTKTASIIILLVLIGGRYLLLLVKWVSVTSKIKDDNSENVSV